MATTMKHSPTPNPTPLTIPRTPPQQSPAHQQSLSPDQQPPSPTSSAQAIYAPLPTRRMLSQLLRRWQQSSSPQLQPTTPSKESPGTPTVSETSPKIDSTTSPQSSRTPSRLMLPPQYTPTPTSPLLTQTTPTHNRRASITTFLPADAFLVSPIPRARNPGGFRHTESESPGDLDEFGGLSPFGEVVGLVGGWEDKMRSATAWAVVNTTNPATIPMEEKGEVEEAALEERGEKKEC